MIKLSNYDARFVVRLLELRRAAILEMTQQLPEKSCKNRAAELKRLDAVLMQIKAQLPQASTLLVHAGRIAGAGPDQPANTMPSFGSTQTR
jgi:hypothetical protein